MKNLTPTIKVFVLGLLASLSLSKVIAQCGAGYVNSSILWETRDFMERSSTGYSSYVSTTQANNQRFAIGPTSVMISLSGLTSSGENGNNTVDGTDDVEFSMSGTSSITLDFATEVQNVRFSIHDLDRRQRVAVSGVNAASSAVSVTVVKRNLLSGIVSLSPAIGIGTTVTATAANSSASNSSSDGTIDISISAAVKTITLNLSITGSTSSPELYLSPISACVPGSFPSNYNQANAQPFTGPLGSQSDYFLVTPDNNSVYMTDANTGTSRLLFTDVSKSYVNSLAYDPYNHILYYISENPSIDANNKQLKKYDLNTNTISVVLADVEASLGIPVMNYGVESAGAAFYDGALYLGIEGGYSYTGGGSSRYYYSRESVVWRIDFDGSLNPTIASQVYAKPSVQEGTAGTGGGTAVQDWGDFIIKNGVLYNFNTARTSSSCATCYVPSSYDHLNLTSSALTIHMNPSNTEYSGQAAMNYNGDLFFARSPSAGVSVIGRYNEDGTTGPTTTIIPVSGGWPGGLGDASESMRPKCDFGDAPASYDPNPVSPAVHERFEGIGLGNNWGGEWTKNASINADGDNADEDGAGYVNVLNPTISTYVSDVDVFNNSGTDATVIGWLDYNGDGVFQSTEASAISIASSTGGLQTVHLAWSGMSSTLSLGDSTFLRIRVVPASYGMTASNPTGFYETGEVEDYKVYVQLYPLPVKMISFQASTVAAGVELSWTAEEYGDFDHYVIERSANGVDWNDVGTLGSLHSQGVQRYTWLDNVVLSGKLNYRLKMVSAKGETEYSEIRVVSKRSIAVKASIAPNPVTSGSTTLSVTMAEAGAGKVSVTDQRGVVVMQMNARLQQGNNQIQITTAKLKPGFYTVQLQKGTEMVQSTFVVQ